ncbi:replication protein A 70 kDa DNA-binding subunit B-like [Bidens hawaiensis]|uniref:replication protein A 70 kDa DNA-binding subunit B-like n=1 Tax=Bidens hawaiensis TaxID=980011 RepID=UPI004049FA65
MAANLPELGNITYLKNLDLSRRDYTVKVRVTRLWKMFLVDEEVDMYSLQGTTVQANVLRRRFARFEHVLNESDRYFIVRPTIGLNESKYKYVQSQTKLGLNYDTHIYPCNDYSGPLYGFSFTNFKGIVDQTFPDNQPLDVIGFVANVGEPKKFKTQKGKETKKLNVIVQDLEMQKIYLLLWDSYTDMILEHWENREQDGIIVIILQFATAKYFGKSSYVNSSYNVSKFFINSEIDEITAFRNSLLLNSAGSSSSTQSSNISGMYLSMYDDYVVRSEFNNIAEVNIQQVKSVVIVGTVRLIPQDVPWYYLACRSCKRKVTKKTPQNNQAVGVLVDQEDICECKTETCNNNVVHYLQRLKVPLTVQDSTGTVFLTLFDREACGLLKTTGSALIEKYGSDNGDTPAEFEALVGKSEKGQQF